MRKTYCDICKEHIDNKNKFSARLHSDCPPQDLRICFFYDACRECDEKFIEEIQILVDKFKAKQNGQE